jgi:integrase
VLPFIAFSSTLSLLFLGAEMATFEKRSNGDGTVYRAKVRLKGFTPESATFARLTDAKDWATQTEADMKAGRYFGSSKRHTFNELLDEYEVAAASLRSFGDRVAHLRYWRETFGHDLLSDISPQRINRARERLLDEDTRPVGRATGNESSDSKRAIGKRSGPTVNRYLATLSACMGHAVKPLGWLEKNPCERVSKSKESPGRVRFLSESEIVTLLDACRPHGDLYAAVVLSLTTGGRQAEIMNLRWNQVDFTRQVITLSDTKNGDRRALPLVGEAVTLLRERAKVRSITDDRVFPSTRNSDHQRCLREIWERTLSAAKIEDFRWHDLRHTAASYLVMSGVSLVEVAKILGHRTMAMVLRYAHLADSHVVESGNKLAAKLGIQ